MRSFLAESSPAAHAWQCSSGWPPSIQCNRIHGPRPEAATKPGLIHSNHKDLGWEKVYEILAARYRLSDAYEGTGATGWRKRDHYNRHHAPLSCVADRASASGPRGRNSNLRCLNIAPHQEGVSSTVSSKSGHWVGCARFRSSATGRGCTWAGWRRRRRCTATTSPASTSWSSAAAM